MAEDNAAPPNDSTPSSAGEPAAGSMTCPWCSTVSPAGTEVCPSCGATLIATGEGAVPGLTALDTESLIRNRVNPRARSGGILQSILGAADNDVNGVPSEAELATSLAPPSTEVQLEIVRLELDAERQRLESARAELESEAAEAAREAGMLPSVAVSASPSTADAEPSSPPAGPSATGPADPPPGPETAATEGDQPAG